ncbi:universal stress protein [Nitrosospira sp. NpAV]|uniref:universal stress protein n=1 Tax=Nitrosospira sp. NpAV TaxID=58133 RepID=UPI0005A01F2B|nr:universal stress protein [Nitrosospira sp. NpAV]KIO49196.1 Universal stress protein family 4 [Nitrosospira sp. NpAV]
MFPVKRIVVATDMSPFASQAEARAAMLAYELGSESLDLLHVIDSLALESLRNLTHPLLDTERRLMESSRQRMDEIKYKLSESYGIPVATITLNVGRPHTEIVRYAELLNAELVVLGAHSGGLMQELFVGSTVDKVLRTLACPLLIVKRQPKVPYRQILIPVDFSECSRRAMEFAMNIAPHAHIIALHAFEVPFEGKLLFGGVSDQQVQIYRAELQAKKDIKMRQFVAEWEAAAGPLSHIVELGRVSAVIKERAKLLEPDLIVIGKHGQSGWEDMLLGSVTKQVVQDAGCDVLIVG